MRKPTALSAIVLCGLALAAAGCNRREEITATPGQLTTPPPSEQLSLWQIDVLQDGKSVSQLKICADRSIEASFMRPAPELNGKPCVVVAERSPTPRTDQIAPVTEAAGRVETETTYSARCRIDDQLYRVGSAVTGDKTRDFTVDMAVTRQDAKGPMFEQVRRYQRLGDCPAGWEIGDSAAPGATEVVNTLTGRTRSIGAPAN
ncbi:hypothetical protein [Phenylobacterium sp.]|uniref:hypothetical protein n=1 Tax=Phenylobacterium sp. TaxID=1871053 RepID=UPI00391BCEA4